MRAVTENENEDVEVESSASGLYPGCILYLDQGECCEAQKKVSMAIVHKIVGQ